MRFVLFVEGHTEKLAIPSFLKRWLDSQLVHPVGIKTVRFEGWCHYESEIAKKVELNISGRAGQDVVAGVGLLDLYGPTFYPSEMKTVDDRLRWAKGYLERKVGNSRFTQHFAVHELEAWLLAAPAAFPKAVGCALPGRVAHPETVDLDEPPAKLLGRLYREKLNRGYRKIIDGVNLFANLDPVLSYRKCPRLKLLLDDMLQRAQGAGL
ncbi:MAG: DUF4276 family protein [Pseudomonadota bacterium]